MFFNYAFSWSNTPNIYSVNNNNIDLSPTCLPTCILDASINSAASQWSLKQCDNMWLIVWHSGVVVCAAGLTRVLPVLPVLKISHACGETGGCSIPLQLFVTGCHDNAVHMLTDWLAENVLPVLRKDLWQFYQMCTFCATVYCSILGLQWLVK